MDYKGVFAQLARIDPVPMIVQDAAEDDAARVRLDLLRWFAEASERGLHPVPRYGFIVDGMNRELPMAQSSCDPDACALPTADRPLRLAEWDDLFATATTGARRSDPYRATFQLRPDPAVAARAADLTVRETRCCSFFTFDLRATGDELELSVTVPSEHVAVLDALAGRATPVAGGGR